MFKLVDFVVNTKFLYFETERPKDIAGDDGVNLIVNLVC